MGLASRQRHHRVILKVDSPHSNVLILAARDYASRLVVNSDCCQRLYWFGVCCCCGDALPLFIVKTHFAIVTASDKVVRKPAINSAYPIWVVVGFHLLRHPQRRHILQCEHKLPRQALGLQVFDQGRTQKFSVNEKIEWSGRI
jgi:hypothetical protein